MTDSILDTSDNQLTLIPSSEMPAALFGDPRNPEYTAERYHSKHPDEYRVMASLLFGDRLPIAAVARMMGRSRNLVDAVYEREASSKSVEQLKQAASRDYRHLAKLGREAMREYLLHLPDAKGLSADQLGSLIQRLAVAIGIADDKAELLSGGATARLAVTDGSETGHQAVLDYLARLKAEYTTRMGLSGETDPTKGDEPTAITERSGDASRTLDVTADVVVSTRHTDNESDATGDKLQ